MQKNKYVIQKINIKIRSKKGGECTLENGWICEMGVAKRPEGDQELT